MKTSVNTPSPVRSRRSSAVAPTKPLNRLADAARDLLQARDDNGRTSLYVATFARQRGAVAALLATGADPGALDRDRYGAVSIAAAADNEQTLRILLSLSASARLVTSRCDVVIADNLSSHKVAGVREAIEAVGATRRDLPPYSPSLNPIVKLFCKLKALLRRAGPRTVDALWRHIGKLLDAFSANECNNCNYFKSSGYVST